MKLKLSIALAASAALAAQAYSQTLTAEPIGPPDGQGVIGINQSGMVLGYTSNRNWRWSAMNGTTLLPTLGGSYSFAYAINANGACVGESSNKSGVSNPVYWAPNASITSIGGRYSYTAQGLDDFASPTIVGQGFGQSNWSGPPVYRLSSKWYTLPNLGGPGRAYGIDSVGRIAGVCSDHVVLWTKNARGGYVLTDLTPTYGMTPGGGGTYVAAVILRNGRVASRSKILNLAMSQVTDLEDSFGKTGVMIRGINDAGQAVGEYDVPGYVVDVGGYYALLTRAPFFYDGSNFYDLRDLNGWVPTVEEHGYFLYVPGTNCTGCLPTSANGINDHGQIVGTGQFGTTGRAYLLTMPG